MIAWKLFTGFGEKKHLLFEENETNYICEAYICTCGHIDFIMKNHQQELKHVCNECENTKFYDANSAWNHIDNFLYENEDVILLFEYYIERFTDRVVSNYGTRIPYKIDFLNKKILFANKSRFSLTITSNGDLEESSASAFYKPMFLKLQVNLTQYVNKNSCFNIPDSKGKNFNLKTVLFFLKNQHLKDFEFCFWDDVNSLYGDEIDVKTALNEISNNRKEKSIKKALYTNYLMQLDNYGRFYTLFIWAITRAISDVNVIVDFLNIDLDYSLFKNTFNFEELHSLIVFLKQYYTEQQILRLFIRDEFNSNIGMFCDAVSESNYYKDVIESNFIKVPCTVKALHDEFVRCAKEEKYKDIHNQVLKYSDEDMEACIKLDTYQIRLPRNGKELFEWAEKLHNCIAGYFNKIKNHKAVIYGFFEEETLVFAVEISNKKLIQASSKYNADLTIQENYILNKWLNFVYDKDNKVIEHVA